MAVVVDRDGLSELRGDAAGVHCEEVLQKAVVRRGHDALNDVGYGERGVARPNRRVARRWESQEKVCTSRAPWACDLQEFCSHRSRFRRGARHIPEERGQLVVG